MSNQQDMVMLPADVADAFVKQYYLILNKCPQNVHKFYQEPSLLGWPGPDGDGVMKPVTTLSGINDKVMSSDYKYCYADVKTTDAQGSLEGGIIVAVTGCLTRKDNVKKNFTQTFFLAKQERGFFVLNDILRLFDVCESVTDTAAGSDNKDDQPAPLQNSVPCNTSDSSTSSETEAAVENGKLEEPLDLSASEDTLANDAVSAPSVASGERVIAPAKSAEEQSSFAPAPNEKEPSASAPAKNAKEPSAAAPAKNAKVPPAAAPTKNAKVPSVVAQATNAKVPSVVAPASIVTMKITYASMLAKETPVTPPTAAAVISNLSKQTVAAPMTKASAPLSDGSPKVSTSSGGVSKAFTNSSKVAPESPTRGRGAPNTSAYPEAKGIYIGGLPYSITKQGIVDVVKKFGPIRRYSDTVQIRRHEDGFCCGFVEFESADAARHAVEAHHVMFGDKEAYITYKRSSYNRGNDGGARSPTRGGNRNGNFRGRENDEWTYYSKGQAKGPRRSSPSEQQPRQAGQDHLK